MKKGSSNESLSNNGTSNKSLTNKSLTSKSSINNNLGNEGLNNQSSSKKCLDSKCSSNKSLSSNSASVESLNNSSSNKKCLNSKYSSSKVLSKNGVSSKGITLIALVISIIVILILAGVSLSATVGDNGLITKAQNAKIYTGMAMLEEYLNQEYVDLYAENQNNPYSTDLDLVRHKRSEWFYKPSQTGLSYVLVDGYVYYLIQKENLPEEIQKNLVGGDANGKTYYDYSRFKDVYGVRSDLKVYYCSDGLSSLIGAEDEHLEDSAAREAIASTSSSGLANFLSSKYGWIKTDADGNILADGLSSLKELTIDDSSVTSLEELYNFSALQTLYLKNLTLESLEGIEYLTSLSYLSIDNCNIEDYIQIASLDNLKWLYLTNTRQNDVNLFVTALSEASNMTKVEYLGIYDSGTNVTDLSGIFGTNATTNIASSIRNSTKYLYAYNNGIASCSLNGYNQLSELRLNSNNNLTSANISSNTVKIIYLNSNSNLSTVNISSSSLKTLYLNYNANLMTVNFSLDALISLSLNDCPNLTTVTAYVPNLMFFYAGNDVNLTSLSGITASTNFYDVGLSNTQISNLDFLQNATNLQKLNISNTPVTNLNNVPVSNLNRLYASDTDLGKNLDVSLNDDGSYTILSKSSTNVFANFTECENLYYVDLRNDKYVAYIGYFMNKSTIGTLLTDGCINLSKISEIDSSIERLDLSNTTLTVSQFESLKNYTNIKYLNLSSLTLTGFASGENYNTVINEVLSELTELITLNLSGNSDLEDITFVSNTPNLRELILIGTKVSTHKVDATGVLGEYETGLKKLNQLTQLKTLELPNINTINFSSIQTAVSNLCHVVDRDLIADYTVNTSVRKYFYR
jgi:Leucine-rich repeat (LRR) protein